jgi:GT2 family glycosyltransferase
MVPLDVTIAVVPRERYSFTERSLEHLYAHTPAPFELVYVSAGAPPSIQRYLEDASKEKGFRLVSTDRFISPNEARNIAMRHVSTKYVVFLDNDALVVDSWLQRLVQCADDTDASIVGPLYLIGELEEQTIHMAGGTLHFKERDGRRIAYDEHRLVDRRLSDLAQPLERQLCDFVEFHCMLLRSDLFGRIGALDERLLSLHEHIDVAWAARNAGGSVYVEPEAVATYVPPPPLEWSDLPYFMLRWCDDWAKTSIEHFSQKWRVAATRHFGDEDSSLDLEDTAVRFARAHRRLAAGMSVPGGWSGGIESAVEQARLMIALLLSVDRDRFALALTTEDDLAVETIVDLKPAEILDRLPGAFDRAERDHLNVLIRPEPPRRPSEPVLVRASLDSKALEVVEPHAFLTLSAGPDRYEVWLAIDTSNARTASIVRRLASSAPGQPEGFSRLAGSGLFDAEQSASETSRIALRKGVAGFVTTGSELERAGVLPQLWACQIY